MSEFLFEDGAIRVAGLPLWLDASDYRADGSPVRRPLNFVSHAHADHLGRHRRVICSAPTLALMKQRQRVEEAVVLDWGEPHSVADATVRLYPAGHVLGSAQILIEHQGTRLCYTGDFRLGRGLTTEECAPVPCDVLLMECTYGHPRYVFPPRQELMAQLDAFVERCFNDQVFPVVLGYTLGKAQEAAKALEELGHGVVAHPSIVQMCDVYSRFGVSFPTLERYGRGPVGRRVIVWPPNKSARSRLAAVGPIRTAVLTGWARDSWRTQLYGADEAIPFSDHCDYNQLIEAARASGARKVYTHHGEADRFADLLRGHGIDAEPLIPPGQQRLF
jgi:putative mRNA 3-end processing factor